jgi:uncharacterized membrane protein
MVPVTGLLIGDAPMILTVFELITMLAIFALGFVFGRIWKIHLQEIRQRSQDDQAGFRIPTAHLPYPLN